MSFINLDGQISPKIWGVLSHYSLNKLSSPTSSCFPSGMPIICRLFLLIVLHSSCRLSALFSFFFLCYSLDNFKAVFSHGSFYLLDPSDPDAFYCIFFSPLIKFFSFIISFGFFLYDFYIFVKHLILFLYCFLDFVALSLCFLIAHWASSKQLFWILYQVKWKSACL